MKLLSLLRFQALPAGRRSLRAFAEAVLPRELPCTPDQVVAFVEDALPAMPRSLRHALPLGLQLLEQGARLSLSTPGRAFSSLPREQRQRRIERWLHTGPTLRRDLVRGLLGLVMVAAYSDRRAWPQLGYDPEAWVASTLARTVRDAESADAL